MLALCLASGCRFGYETATEPLRGAAGDADASAGGDANGPGAGGALDSGGDPSASGGGSDLSGSGGTTSAGAGGATSGGGTSGGATSGGGGATSGAAGTASGGTTGGAGGTVSGGTGGSVSGGAGGSVSGGTGGTVSGGSAGTSSAGSGGTGGAAGDLVVTTGLDENDAGATVASPGGTGLSLREAITISNATAGSQTITFKAGITVAPSGVLPVISDGVTITGGVVDAKGAPNNKDCLQISAGPTTLDGLEIGGCRGRPVYVSGGNDVKMQNCYFHGSGGALETASTAGTGTIIGPGNKVTGSVTHCVAVYNSGARVIDNQITDCSGNGLFLSGTVSGAQVVGNLILRGNYGVGMGAGTTNVVMWFNTIAQNTITGVNVGQASGHDVRDNIFAFNVQWGVAGTTAKFTQLDYNLYFGNGSGACSSCAAGAHSVQLDPLFGSTATDDYSLQLSSPAINAGVAVGVDRNGGSAGDYNGTAPDLGCREAP